MSAYVYIMASGRIGTLYVGSTVDLVGRVLQHKEYTDDGFTKKYDVTKLVYYEFHETIYAARIREYRLKRWRRAWKIELIESANPDWRDLFSGIA